MRRILFIVIAGCALLASCSSSKKATLPALIDQLADSTGVVPVDSHGISAADTIALDTLSNFSVFDYIQYLESKDYSDRVDSLEQGLSVDFFTMRMAYTKTEAYSPYDIKIGNLHQGITSAIDSLQFRRALSLSDSILADNYIDIQAHLYRGYIFNQLGDSLKSDFHYAVYEGLLESIYLSGNGYTPRTAYIVVSTKEEYAFIGSFNMAMQGQSLIHAQGHSFDLLSVLDRETKETFELYFNVSLPFRQLAKETGD